MRLYNMIAFDFVLMPLRNARITDDLTPRNGLIGGQTGIFRSA